MRQEPEPGWIRGKALLSSPQGRHVLGAGNFARSVQLFPCFGLGVARLARAVLTILLPHTARWLEAGGWRQAAGHR